LRSRPTELCDPTKPPDQGDKSRPTSFQDVTPGGPSRPGSCSCAHCGRWPPGTYRRSGAGREARNPFRDYRSGGRSLSSSLVARPACPVGGGSALRARCFSVLRGSREVSPAVKTHADRLEQFGHVLSGTSRLDTTGASLGSSSLALDATWRYTFLKSCSCRGAGSWCRGD
jgi:hypothetical protein